MTEINLPQGWAKLRLSDAIQPRGEKAQPADYPDAPFLGMDHVEAQTTRIISSVPAGTMKSSAAKFYAGDVLYGRLRPYLNKVAQPSFSGLASAEFIVFPDTKFVASKFLRFRLNAADFVSFASHLNEGDRPRVGFEQIGDFEVLIPPPAEQHRIVAKIEELFSELDKGIEALKTAREQLKVYRQALLKHAFEGKLTAAWRAANPDKLEPAAALLARIQTEREQRYQQQLQQWQTTGGSLVQRAGKPKAPKPLPPLTTEELAELPELPEGWGWVKFGELVQSSQNGISKRNSETGKEFIVLRLADIVAQRISLESPRAIRLSEEEIQNYVLRKDELLCIRVNGSPDLVGRMVLVNDEVEAAFCDHFIRFKLVEGICSPVFLRYFFDTHGVRRYVELNKVSSAGQNTVNQEMLSSVVVAICGIEEQKEIIELLEQKLSEADQLDQTLTTTLQQSEALRQSILKRAFSGQLVPQDPHDEPASALLARIKAEKGAQSAMPRKTGKGKT